MTAADSKVETYIYDFIGSKWKINNDKIWTTNFEKKINCTIFTFTIESHHACEVRHKQTRDNKLKGKNGKTSIQTQSDVWMKEGKGNIHTEQQLFSYSTLFFPYWIFDIRTHTQTDTFKDYVIVMVLFCLFFQFNFYYNVYFRFVAWFNVYDKIIIIVWIHTNCILIDLSAANQFA